MSNVEVVVVDEKSKGKASKLRQPPRPVGGPVTDLKSERVQEELASMPGWRALSGMRDLERFHSFPTPVVAAAYAEYVKAFAEEVGQRCSVAQSCEHVTVTVLGSRAKRGIGIKRPTLDFARRLG